MAAPGPKCPVANLRSRLRSEDIAACRWGRPQVGLLVGPGGPILRPARQPAHEQAPGWLWTTHGEFCADCKYVYLTSRLLKIGELGVASA